MAHCRALHAHFAPLVPSVWVRRPRGLEGAAVAVCPMTPLRGRLQPTDFTMVDAAETAGPKTYDSGPRHARLVEHYRSQKDGFANSIYSLAV